MTLPRRRFLTLLASTPLVYGLSRITAAEDEEPPTWVRDALAEMKRTGKPGLAFVLPPDSVRREALRATLEGAIKASVLAVPFTWRTPPQRQSWLLEAVCLVAPAAAVRAAPGETLVLLEADGSRARGTARPLEAGSLPTLAHRLLRAGHRLEQRAELVDTAELRQHLDDLASLDESTCNAARQWLIDRFDRVLPVLLTVHEHGHGTKWLRVDVLMGEQAAQRSLPYGTRWSSRLLPDPCTGCGMMMAPFARSILELLTDEPAK